MDTDTFAGETSNAIADARFLLENWSKKSAT